MESQREINRDGIGSYGVCVSISDAISGKGEREKEKGRGEALRRVLIFGSLLTTQPLSHSM